MVAVSIVTYNTDTSELGRCLRSLESGLVKKIWIIDNSSQEYIRKFCTNQSNVEYIANKNVGYGAGHNIAIRKSLDEGYKYHLVLNSDVRFSPDVIAKLCEYLNENDDVAQVQPRILNPDGSLQYTCRLLPTPANLIFRRFLPNCISQKLDYKYLLKGYDHHTPADIAYHQGSFMLFRVCCFKKIGLFDERFFMYPEDIDITRRMHRHYRTMYWPAAEIIHDHRAESYKSLRMLRIHIVNMVRYFNKWGWFYDRERKQCNNKILRNLHLK